jgi:hypothetical protein
MIVDNLHERQSKHSGVTKTREIKAHRTIEDDCAQIREIRHFGYSETLKTMSSESKYLHQARNGLVEEVLLEWE